MAKLNFDIAAIRAAVRHAQSSTEHRAGFEQAAVPALHFVKDDGIYIMSSGIPVIAEQVVYAEGYNPKVNEDCWEASRDAVGGDDFVEVIPLTETLLRIINDPTAGKFFVKVTPRTFTCGVTPRRGSRRPATAAQP